MAQVNQLVIQDMKDGVLVVDERGVIRQINRRAVEILGPLPKTGRELTLRDYTPALADRLQRWREDPAPGSIRMRTVLTHRLMGARFVPVGKSRNVGVVVFLEDLTRIQAEAQQMKLACHGPAHRQYRARDPQPPVGDQPRRRAAAGGAGASTRRSAGCCRSCTTTPSASTAWCRTCSSSTAATARTGRPSSWRDFLRTFVAQFCQIEKVPEEVIDLSAGASIRRSPSIAAT